MKITINSKTLLKSATQAGSVVNSGGVIPIIQNIMFNVSEDGTITLTGTDLETTLERVIKGVTVDGSGAFVAPSKTLLSLLKSLKSEDIVLETSENMLKVEASTGKYDMPIMNAEDFPKPTTAEFTGSFTTKGYVLSTIIEKASIAVSEDTMRPALCGVLFDITPEGTSVVSTDGHRLVEYKTKISADEAQLVIPTKPLSTLKGLQDEDVTVQYNNTNIVFDAGEFVVTARLVDGKYPNYKAVIPQNQENVFKVEQKDILETVKRVSLFSNEKSKQIKISFGLNTTVSTQDLDMSNSASETIDATYEGHPQEVGFNSRYLVEMLNNSGEGAVNITMGEPSRPVLLKNPKSPGMTCLVMPVAL